MKQSSGGSCALLVCDINMFCVQKDGVFTLKRRLNEERSKIMLFL